MILYVAAQCWDYELRWSWFVSSMLQQKRPKSVDVIIDCATLGQHKYQYPPFEGLCPYPESWPKYTVSLRYFTTAKDVFAQRGLTRNEQALRARDAGARWVWWADADHVYPPEFVWKVSRWCRRHHGASGCITASHKLHTSQDAADALVREFASETYHPHAYERAIGLPMRYKCERGVAGGCMQLVSRRTMRRLGWQYVDPAKCRDRDLFKKGQMARSDLQFRRDAGGTVLVDWPLQIHLDHRRDKEEKPKRHIEGLQR